MQHQVDMRRENAVIKQLLTEVDAFQTMYYIHVDSSRIESKTNALH